LTAAVAAVAAVAAAAFDVLFSAVDIPMCSTHLHINIGIKWQ
jgi:hypothetical protein